MGRFLKENKFKSLRLVTSNYHIKRSLLEFQQQMPSKEIIPHPVFTNNFTLKSWWRSSSTAKLILLEYNKYLAIKIAYLLGRNFDYY